MYLSPSDIQHTRIHTIDNLHAASRAWVEATERLSELALRAGRLALDEGRIRAGDLATYLIPTSLDLPDIACLALADDEPTGPLGLKGMGEVGIHGPGPAVAQALFDAIGLDVASLPVAPEAVLAAFKDQRP